MTPPHDPTGPTTLDQPPTATDCADPRLESLLSRLAEEAALPHWSDDARYAIRKAHQWACQAFGVSRPPPSSLRR